MTPDGLPVDRVDLVAVVMLVAVVVATTTFAGPRSARATAARVRRRVRGAEASAGPFVSAGGRRAQSRVGRRPRSVDLDHAVVLEAVARAVRSGSSFTGALGEAVVELPPSDAVRDLERALAGVRAGASVVEALERWAAPGSGRARVLAGSALVLAAELGGMPARSLDAAAAGLRDRAALAREVRALSSQARASATVMVLGPPVFLVLAAAADRRLLSVLFGSPIGVACLVAGVALDLSGAWWMAVLVRWAR